MIKIRDDATISPYIQLAEELQKDFSPEKALAHKDRLPRLNRKSLDRLGEAAFEYSKSQPKTGWTLMAIVDAIVQDGDYEPMVHALAAWHLGRAANGWFNPLLVPEPLERARNLFEQLNEPGWVAACDWQRQAVPWMWPDFKHSVTVLEGAIDRLLGAGLEEYAAHCCLSLAYALMLVGEFDEAAKHVAKAEAVFTENNDQFGIAYSLFVKANYQRRSSKLNSAQTNIEQAIKIFEEIESKVFFAIANYSLAYTLYIAENDFVNAQSHFQLAKNIFTTLDLSIWEAQCEGGLAQVYTHTGNLKDADVSLKNARHIYQAFELLGPLADNLLDSGQRALFRGDFLASLSFLDQAEARYIKNGNSWVVPIVQMHQGDAYLQNGNYYEALSKLEKAYALLERGDIYYRIAECEWRLADVWLNFGRIDNAQHFLNQAIQNYELAGHIGHLLDTYYRRAEIYLESGDWQQAVETLRFVIEEADQKQIFHRKAYAQRLMSEALMLKGDYDAALANLKEPKIFFNSTGMFVEEAACELLRGRFCQLLGTHSAAKEAWLHVLELSNGIAPELEGEAFWGLAGISSSVESSIKNYEKGASTLARLRKNLWQPALAGTLLKRSSSAFDRAVALVATHRYTEKLFYFVEEGKSQTVARQLIDSDQPLSAESAELIDLAAEIRWLQQKQKELAHASRFETEEATQVRRSFISKVQEYDEMVGRNERANRSEPAAIDLSQPNLAGLRQRLNEKLGQDWLALDYYFTDDQVYALIIDPAGEDIWSKSISSQAHFLLDFISKGRYKQIWSPADLQQLSRFLVPPNLYKRLTPETRLVIAPHRQLHRVPWTALPIGDDPQPLVGCSIPVVVPSLQSLLILWDRQPDPVKTEPAGLMLAVSDFQGRHHPLPAVIKEAEKLQQMLGEGLQLISNEQATLSKISDLGREKKLSQFAFLHMVTHAFSDQVTGRLSGLALYDDDLWLDELSQMAPLPPLVTLSACSGLRSRIYAGDEHVGLAVSCLAAGTRSVIGSLWPVADSSGSDMFVDFYKEFLAGKGVSEALALAQRKAIQKGANIRYWGGFQCVGAP